MVYTIMVIAMPQAVVVECCDVFADTDAEAMELAMNQACFTGETDYRMLVSDALGEFCAYVQCTRSTRISTPDTV